ncbi:MAG: T9SS type A sorting domain-containing protein, partial [Clostridia bacterium]|nr:T9SS type A sorting domain-containing protein [Clostridia bacterium]
HGSTDAPTVDVYEVGVGAGLLIDNFMYTDFAGYLELPTANYSLQIRDESGEIAVATFAAQLAGLQLQGQAITVVASGFLTPENNSNGSSFGLYAALASGGQLVALTNTSSIEEAIDIASLSIYPNPATTQLNIDFAVKQDQNLKIEILSMTGAVVLSEQYGNLTRNSTFYGRYDMSQLPGGLYLLSITSGESSVARKIQIIN